MFRSRPDLRVRLDANNLGTDPGEFIRHIQALDADIFAIEEPLRAGDLGGFREVARACRTKIILDESLLRGEQLDALDDSGSWIVNLRVSKLGGLIRSLDLAGRAARKGIGIIVGAQVGETSLLTRAGLSVMHGCRSALVASEGAFGTHLVKRDLTEPCLMFGHEGVLSTAALPSDHGLGLQVSRSGLCPLP